MIELRPMTGPDLALVAAWLRQPHVGRWWLQDVTAEEPLQEYADRVADRGDLGTELIAALVDDVRQHHPGCGILVEPDAANAASWRVLERNGFELVDVRPLAFELNDRPMAIYRLAGGG